MLHKDSLLQYGLNLIVALAVPGEGYVTPTLMQSFLMQKMPKKSISRAVILIRLYNQASLYIIIYI